MLALKRRKPLDTSSSPLDMFGNPNPDYRPPRPRQDAPTPAARIQPAASPPAPAASPPRPEATPARPMPAGLTDEAIASFDAAGIEAQFRVPELGEVWLVSERTGRDRVELTARDLLALARVVTVFDGARVVSIEKALAAPA